MCAMRFVSVEIPPDCEGLTVDYVLRTCLGASDRAIRRAKRVDGAVLLDGVPARCKAKVSAGQRLSLLVEDVALGCAATSINPQPGPLDILYQDEGLLIVNKQAGIVVHPSPGHDQDTLANYVAFHLKEQGISACIHPVSRLDSKTTGAVVFALNGHVHNRLEGLMHTQGFQREYLALCEGHFRPGQQRGTIDAPWARLTRHPNTFGVQADGKKAVTHYQVIDQRVLDGRPVSAVRLELETGRTHQIRIHMQYAGHPLIGDVTYGAPDKRISRHALHSWRVELTHPVTQRQLSIEAALPSDMLELAHLSDLRIAR